MKRKQDEELEKATKRIDYLNRNMLVYEVVDRCPKFAFHLNFPFPLFTFHNVKVVFIELLNKNRFT